MGAAADGARSSSFSSPSGGGGSVGPLSMGRHGPGGAGGEDGDSLISKRMPYCMAMLVLLAIVYVLARLVTVVTLNVYYMWVDVGVCFLG